MNIQEKIAGTFILDGMLRGDLGQDFEGKLRDWIKLCAEMGLHFNLEIDGGEFSMLAMPDVSPVAPLQPSLSERIKELLEQLIAVAPASTRESLFSTLRSIEYRKGAEVQTLYAVTPKGEVEAKQRTQEAQTTEAEKPLTRAEKTRLVLAGLAVFLLMILVSAIFVDYRSIFTKVKEDITALDPKDVVIESVAYKNFFTVEDKKVDDAGRTLVVLIKRTDKFPTSDAAFDQAQASVKDTVVPRLTVENLARGYVRVEFFNEKNEFLYQIEDRVTDLRNKDKIVLRWPIPRNIKPSRVVITY